MFQVTSKAEDMANIGSMATPGCTEEWLAARYPRQQIWGQQATEFVDQTSHMSMLAMGLNACQESFDNSPEVGVGYDLDGNMLDQSPTTFDLDSSMPWDGTTFTAWPAACSPDTDGLSSSPTTYAEDGKGGLKKEVSILTRFSLGTAPDRVLATQSTESQSTASFQREEGEGNQKTGERS